MGVGDPLSRLHARAAATSDRTYWLRELWGGTVVGRAPGLGGLWLVSIHSKAESRRPSEFPADRMRDVVMCATGKVWEIERAAADLGPLLAGNRFVAGGDLNSSLRFDRVYRRDANRKLFANLDRAGLKDLRLPFSAEEHRTYFKKGRGPYQLDHVFADAETRDATRGWRVLAEASSGLGLSDHAPIEVILGQMPGGQVAVEPGRADTMVSAG